MPDGTAIIIGSVVLALAVIAASWLFARGAEHAASRAKASARNARTSADEVRQGEQRVQGMVAAFRDGRPSEVDWRPTCPMDGEPLASFDAQPGQPTRYVHTDGLIHDDFSRPVRADGRPTPPPYTPPPPAEVTAKPSTVDSYFHRVDQGVAAGVIDPDRLRTGVADITRNPEFTQAMQQLADSQRQTEEPERRRMPDPSRAARIQRTKPSGSPSGPHPRNGDGT
jgi:type II secretory pathway pseudopilin PulG